MKKIAVQLFGHMRTYKKCSKYLYKYLLSKNDCDVFIHTWDKSDHMTKTWRNNSKQIYPIYEEDIRMYYKNIKSIAIESQSNDSSGVIEFLPSWQGNYSKVSYLGVKSMFYSMFSVNELRKQYERKNNISYDMIIFIRPDIMFLDSLNIHAIVENSSDNFYFAGKMQGNFFQDFSNLSMTDCIFFSTPQLFEKIFESDKCFLENVHVNYKYNFPPEYLLLNRIINLGIKILWINFAYGKCWYISREEKMRLSNIFNIKLNSRSFIINFFRFLNFKVEFSIGKIHK